MLGCCRISPHFRTRRVYFEDHIKAKCLMNKGSEKLEWCKKKHFQRIIMRYQWMSLRSSCWYCMQCASVDWRKYTNLKSAIGFLLKESSAFLRYLRESGAVMYTKKGRIIWNWKTQSEKRFMQKVPKTENVFESLSPPSLSGCLSISLPL